MTQTGTFRRAFNNARNVRHDERLAVTNAHHAQIRNQRGKVVVCNLRTGSGRHGQQRGLADVRETDEADIRQQLQLQTNLQLLSRHSRLRKPWGLTGRGRKVHIAPAAAAALCCDKRLGIRQILDDLSALRIAQNRAARHTNDQIFAVLAGAALASALLARLCLILSLVSKIHQSRQVVIYLKNDGATAAAVAAVRAAGCNILLTVK